MQLVVNPEHAPGAAAVAHDVRVEFVLRAEGEVVARAEVVNPNLATGEIEVAVDTLEVVSRCPPLPFQLDEEGVDETLRIRYRWLDLRRERLQRSIRTRARLVSIIRQEMEAAGFVDVETPIMAKPTPEARATSSSRPAFSAAASSPCRSRRRSTSSCSRSRASSATTRSRAVSGRDLRADRLQELTQLDVEMAFPDREILFGLVERTVARIWRELREVELDVPFERVTYAEADRRYGTDKPDLRFGLEIEDATEVTRESGFGVFANAPTVRFLRAPQASSRGASLRPSRTSPGWGPRGSPISSATRRARCARRSRDFSPSASSRPSGRAGTTLLFAADEPAMVSRVLGGCGSDSAATSTSSTATRGGSSG